MKAVLEFTDRDVAGLLCSALEGNMIRSWVTEYSAHFKRGTAAKPWGEEYTPSYIAAPFTQGGHLLVCWNDIDGDGDVAHSKRIGRKQLEKGLSVMSAKNAYQFGQFLAGNYDEVTGDVFLQCCVMGEVIFG